MDLSCNPFRVILWQLFSLYSRRKAGPIGHPAD